MNWFAQTAKAWIAAIVPAVMATGFAWLESNGIVLGTEAKLGIISAVTGFLVWLIPNAETPPAATK